MTGRRRKASSIRSIRTLERHNARSSSKASATRRAADCFGPARRPRHARSASRRALLRSSRRLFARPRMVQRRCGGARAGAAKRPAAQLIAIRRPDHRTRDRVPAAATGPARSPGIPCGTIARRGHGRYRTAGCRLLAANAAARQWRCSRPVALRLSAAARRM